MFTDDSLIRYFLKPPAFVFGLLLILYCTGIFTRQNDQ